MDVFTFFDENPWDFYEDNPEPEEEDRWWDDRTWSIDIEPGFEEDEEEDMPDEANISPITREVDEMFVSLCAPVRHTYTRS